MNTLRLEGLIIPAADLGLENPLAPLRSPTAVPQFRIDTRVPEHARTRIGYGCGDQVLPYSVQDQYNRDKTPRAFKTAVLENDFLRATFLLDLGGRLYSLFHKPKQRELLYVNPVFQPANLAVRNAWFSGGIEWNCGVPGHTPLTCSPIFAARVTADDGSPILRLYEFERIRRVTYQIDFSLSPDSPLIFARVRICNPNDHEVPMYWWTNIAIPETPKTRVIVPADAAYNSGSAGLLQHVTVPRHNNVDNTYPSNSRVAADFFYDIPEGIRPWIVALDQNGTGLFQTSTQAQRGRKLFVWGTNPGGRHWQEFLSIPNHPYIEIQAGVARTQFESFPLAARAQIGWIEAFGLITANPAAAHSRHWDTARQEIASQIESLIPASHLDARLTLANTTDDRKPDEILHRGAGWAILELDRQRRSNEPNAFPAGLVFDDSSLTVDQAPWLSLLHSGFLPHQSPDQAPGAYMVDDSWRARLEQSLSDPRGNHWLAYYHLGVMYYAAKDPNRAKQAWNDSIVHTRSAWAFRNLAVAALHDHDLETAADLLLGARDLLPSNLPITIECLNALLAAHCSVEALALLETIPPEIRSHGRVLAIEVRAAIDSHDLPRAQQLLSTPFQLPDIREGELLLSDLWYSLIERNWAAEIGQPLTPESRQALRQENPPPAWLDFRMAGIEA